MRHLCDDSWRQVQVHAVNDLIAHRLVRVSQHQVFGELLPIRLASTIMLYLDVQVLATFRSEELATAIVRANESAVDLLGSPSQMLLPLVLALVRRAGRGPGGDFLFGNRSRIVFRCSVGLALCSLLLLLLLGTQLTLSGFLQQLLLMLLLPQPV